MEIGLAISISAAVISIVSFALSRKDKSSKDAGDSQFKMGVLENKIDNLSKQVEKILDKLDSYDKEINEKIDEAIRHHVAEMHHKEG